MASALRYRPRILILALLRLLVWLPLWLLGLLLLLLGLGLSPWGTSWLVERGEHYGLFVVESVSGSPLEAFELNGLSLQAGPAVIYIEHLELAWADDCLLDGKLCLDGLLVEGADIRIDESDKTAQPDQEEQPSRGGMTSFYSPFAVELRALMLRDVHIRLADGTQFEWQQFSTGARLTGNSLTFLPTRLNGALLQPALSAGQQLAQKSAAEVDSDADIALMAEVIDTSIAIHSPRPDEQPASQAEEQRPLAERERLSLPEIRLPLDIVMPSLVIDDFRLEGATPYRVDRLALSLASRGHEVSLYRLALATPDLDAELSGDIRLEGDYPLDIELSAMIHRQPIEGETLRLELQGSLAELDILFEGQGPIEARLEGQVDALAPTLPFKVDLESNRLNWPPAGDVNQQFSLHALMLRAEGDLTDYEVALSGTLSGSDIPEEVRIAVAGEGDLEHFIWRPLSLAAGSGALISHGEARWSPSLDVNTQLYLNDFSLEAITTAVNGRLNGDAQLHFAMADAGHWSLDIAQIAIAGTLQDRPLQLDARLSGNSDMHWLIEELQLRQGRNRLDIQGQVEETIGLTGELDAPALESLLPELAGRADGHFQLSGHLDAPQLTLQMSANQLRYAENSLESLRIDADVEGLDDPRLDINLMASGMEAAGQRLTRLQLNLAGRLSQHRLELFVDADEEMPLSRASLAVAGGLNAAHDHYRGSLSSLEVDSEQAHLRLDEPMDFGVDLNNTRIETSPFCILRRQGGSLCATQPIQASAERGEARLALREFPMDLLATALPEQWSADGQSDGELLARWASGGQWSAQANLESHLALSGEDAYGNPWSLPDSTLTLNLEADNRQAQAQLRVSLADAGRLQLELRIDEPTGEAALQGRLQAEAIQLTPYRTMVTGLQRLEGAIASDIRLGGTLQQPQLNGQLALEGLQVAGGSIPLEIRDGQLGVDLHGDNATIDGFIAAEEGRLDLHGDAVWPAPGEWRANLALDGRDSPLLVVMPQFGRLHIAPDLQLNAAADLLQIRGQVRVPWGRLTAGAAPPSAISVSADEVIITREEDQRNQQAQQQGAATAQQLEEAGMALDVLIEVLLGPDVQFEAYGLEAGLVGSLEVHQGSGPVQLYGDVNIEDGRYRAFGQDLLIRKGQVLFSGPASQPRLQIDAIRNPDTTEDDVIAGLRVTGPAAQPSLSIFSEPAMDESRALSYLLRGRAPEDSDSDGALTSALIGLSLSRTGGAVGQLGQAFGIDDLSLDTAGSGEDSQVVVSGYLFEDLKVSYGVGIFSPIAELTLRYRLLQNLYVEAISGAAQAVDLIYTFSLGRTRMSR